MVTNTEAKTYVSLVAKIVRIITIPPFMILVLLIVLYFSEKESFAILLCISVWASLHMKRHKPVDIVMGVVSFLISYALALVNTRLLI